MHSRQSLCPDQKGVAGGSGGRAKPVLEKNASHCGNVGLSAGQSDAWSDRRGTSPSGVGILAATRGSLVQDALDGAVYGGEGG